MQFMSGKNIYDNYLNKNIYYKSMQAMGNVDETLERDHAKDFGRTKSLVKLI